jgi:hypothetical protein
MVAATMRIAARAGLVFASAVMAGACLPSNTIAQANNFAGAYGEYRQRLATFALRADSLVDEIADVSIRRRYCSTPARDSAGRRLAELRVKLGELRREWSDFRASIGRTVETSGAIREFEAVGENPKAPNFWTVADRQVIDHPAKDLDAKVEQFRGSEVVECTASATSPSPPVEPSPPPRANLLDGLTRPNPFDQAVPPVPQVFCSEEAVQKWIDDVIKPLLAANIAATSALRDYESAVSDRLTAALRASPMDAGAVRTLDAEQKWAHAEHERLDAIYYRILGIARAAKAVDCTSHTMQDTGKRAGADTDTGARPRTRQPTHFVAIGGGGDVNSYFNFKRTVGDAENNSNVSGGQTTGGWSIGVDYRFSKWGIGVSRHANTLQYTESVPVRNSAPRIYSGTLDGLFYDFRVYRRAVFKGLIWRMLVGTTIASDVLRLYFAPFGVPSGPSETRSLTTLKTNFGFEVERPLTRGFDVYAGYGLTVGRWHGDADLNGRLSAGGVFVLDLDRFRSARQR